MLPVNLPKKRNLMKDRVGMPRTSTYNLPSDPNYVYGRPNNRNDEGSGDSKYLTANILIKTMIFNI